MTADVEIASVDPYDDTQIAALHAVVEAANRYERDHATPWTAVEMAVALRSDPIAVERTAWLALNGGEPVGGLIVDRSLKDNLHLLAVDLSVTPSARRWGIGTALARVVLDVAREHARTTLWAWITGVATNAQGSPVTDEPTAGEAFATAFGMGNKLTSVHRVLDLPVPAQRLDPLRRQAAAHGAGYRLVEWVGACPDGHIEAYARLRSLIGSQAPLGDLDMEEERWDGERLRDETRRTEQMQRLAYTTAVVGPDGDLVGHTQLVVPGSDPGPVYQQDTLVLPAHRGHRLGLALKVANLARVQAEHPDRTEAHTFNAASNEPMVAVNDALGFRPVELAGEWQGPVPAAPTGA